MPAAASAVQTLLCADQESAVADVRRLLEQAGHQVRWHAIDGSTPDDLGTLHLIVLEGSRRHADMLSLCRRLRSALKETLVPALFITDDHGPAARLASLDAGADTYLLRPFAPAELLAQTQALLRMKDLHDRLADKSAEVLRINKRLQQAYQQIDQELELAQRIQMSFLPQKMPDVPGVRFGVHYALCGRVGGDFYDVFRLDEQHLGFYVADAVGHGVPACLLAIFVKKGVRSKEIFGQTYRLLPPGEVLALLNRDLLAQALSEKFITMAYGLLNFTNGNLTLARAGHPYPLLVPRSGEPELLQTHGSLLGVFETSFPDQTRGLRPGDKLLFYSDGIDTGRFGDNAPGLDSLKACAARHYDQPIQDLITHLARDLFQHGAPTDDLTLLGLEMIASGKP